MILQKLKAAFAAATQGEWDSSGEVRVEIIGADEFPECCICECKGGLGAHEDISDETLANAAFIALSHEAMPLLLEGVDILEESLSAWEDEEDSVKAEHASLIKKTKAWMAKLNDGGTPSVKSPMNIGELMKSLPHFADVYVESEVLDMPVDSGCGRDCADVLLMGNRLAELCADERSAITKAVAKQVRVFYFG